MNRNLIHLVLVLLLSTNNVAAQQPSEGTRDRYVPGKLSRVIKDHSDNAEVRTKGVDVGSDPVRVRVIYTGISRLIVPAKRRLIAFSMQSNGAPEFAKKFATEFLFIEDGVEFWLPVQDVLIPYFGKELRKGQRVELFAEWIGLTYPERNSRGLHVFIVNEFTKPEQGQLTEQALPPWYNFTGPGKDFTIEFPSKPSREDDSQEHLTLVQEYYTHGDSIFLAITFQDAAYPTDSRMANELESSFEQTITAGEKEHGVKIIRVQRLAKNISETEKWLPAKKPNTYLHQVSRSIVHGGRLYTLHCGSTVADQGVNKIVCHRFFDSFHLIGVPQ